MIHHALFQGDQSREETLEDVGADLIGDFGFVGLLGGDAGLELIHPRIAIGDQRVLKRLPGRALRADDVYETLKLPVSPSAHSSPVRGCIRRLG